MKEVEVQKLIVDAVREAGGAAHKLSNRFSIGVPDLLIKLPRNSTIADLFPAMLMEVKLEKYADVNKLAERGKTTMPDVTVPQHSFLTDYAKAGMLAGVMTFIVDRRGLRGLWLCVAPPFKKGHEIRLADFAPCGGHQDRNRMIVETLKQFAREK